MSTAKILLAIAILASIAVPLIMRSQRSEPAPALAPAVAAKPAAPARPKAPAPKPVAEPEHERFGPVSDEVRQKADALIRLAELELPNEEMMQRPEIREFTAKMMGVMTAMSPETKSRMMKTVKDGSEAIKAFTGGMGMLDPKNLGAPAGRGFVEAVYSGEPERLADWSERMTNEVMAETALDPNLERTTSGIIIRRGPLPKGKTDGPPPE